MYGPQLNAMPIFFVFFFLKDRPPPESYPLPLPAALPSPPTLVTAAATCSAVAHRAPRPEASRTIAASDSDTPSIPIDRKSTRLNSSHLVISYAVFCLKKKTRTVSGLYMIAMGDSCDQVGW